MITYALPNKIFRSYIGPRQLPESWKCDATGALDVAVQSWRHGDALSEGQLRILIEYCDYYVSAPCWVRPRLDGNPRTDDEIALVKNFREAIKRVETVVDLETWLIELAGALEMHPL